MTNPEALSPMISTDLPVLPAKWGSPRLAKALLLLAIAAGLLAPIWTVRFPLLVDYPNHLASAFVLAHLRDAAFHFGEYYRADWNVYPYLSMDVILLGLQHLVAMEVAGRLVLTLCVLSVPAAAWFFLRRAKPEDQSLALWSLLFATTCISSALAF